MHSQNEIEKQVRTFRLIGITSALCCVPGFQRIYLGGGGNLIAAGIQLILAPIWFILIWLLVWLIYIVCGSIGLVSLGGLLLLTIATALIALPLLCICGALCGIHLLICPCASCICLITAIFPGIGEIMAFLDVINADTLVAKKHFIMRRDRMLETQDSGSSGSFNEPFVVNNRGKRGSFGAKFADFSAAGAFGAMDAYNPPNFGDARQQNMKIKFNGVPEGVNVVSFNTEKNEESEFAGGAEESQISSSMQSEIRDVEAQILKHIEKPSVGVLLMDDK